MRIQFVGVPSEGSSGVNDKILMCISEVENPQQVSSAALAQAFKDHLGVSAVLVTDEVVRFEPAQPEDEFPVTANEAEHIAELLQAGAESTQEWSDAEMKLADTINAMNSDPELWFACPRSGYNGLTTPYSSHGPCKYLAHCRDNHCRCGHA